MAIQFLGGTTQQNDEYVGPSRSLTIDIEAGNIRLHDGETPGGWVIGNLGQIPVQSVNGQTGDVNLSASDVGAYPDSNPSNFVDANGARSAVAGEGYLTEVSWNDVSGKPSTFPPSSHTHSIANVSGLQNALNDKAPINNPTFTGTVTIDEGTI